MLEMYLSLAFVRYYLRRYQFPHKRKRDIIA